MKTGIEFNEITEKLPKHLHKFIVKQPYAHYTSQNQAVWRYAMRKNIDYLKTVAHDSYLEGIRIAGLTEDTIPRMEGMNRILKEIGWAAVAVDGFIPPNAFMEFQAYNVLVIASDIRTIEHIEYTPAPDILHEAAGHAPMIANPEYAEYLRRFGAIGCKAISSAQDYEMYEAIRLLSILKEDPNATTKEIKQAEEKVLDLQNTVSELSEMAKIRNLHWWTVEYGLVGTLKAPKIYGAGLLSSIGESKWCMRSEVQKTPYSITAAHQSFDITKPQPQLFVTPDFAHLSYVLEAFANTMAIRKGGRYGVETLIESTRLGSIELSTGVQISGVFTRVILDEKGHPAYFQTTGPTALSYQNKELIGHDKRYHSNGFGSPLGRLKGSNMAIEDMYPKDLEVYGIYEGKHTTLEFEGGIIVSGEVITGTRNLMGKIILISFKNCEVIFGDEILFHPDWGIYDMAVGKNIVSAFSGAADPASFEEAGTVSTTETRHPNYDAHQKKLHTHYEIIAQMRATGKANVEKVDAIFEELLKIYPEEWLLPLEMYELLKDKHTELAKKIRQYLEEKSKDKGCQKLIQEGLAML